MRDADRAVAVGVGQVREDAELGAGEIAERHGDGDAPRSRPASGAGRSSPASRGSRRSTRGTARRPAGTMPGPRTSADAARSRSPRPTAARRDQSGAPPRPAGARDRRESGTPPSSADLAQRFLELRSPHREAQRADEELHAVLLLVLVVAEPVEDAEDRLRDLEHVVAGRKSYSSSPPLRAGSTFRRRP